MKNILLKHIIFFSSLLTIWSCTKGIEPIASSSGITITPTNDFKALTDIKFSAVATNSSSVKWEFYRNNQLIDATNELSPTRKFLDVGNYTVIFKAVGDSGSSGQRSTFTIKSEVDFTYTGGDCEAPCEVIVSATTFFIVDIFEFEWNWGDQTPTTKTATLSAKHLYSKEGNYPISLIVRYRNGTIVTITSKSVTIKAPLLLSKITNAWSGGGNAEDFGVKVVTDKDGNVIVAGNFRGTAFFGGQTIRYKENNPQSYGTFVAKYNNTGSLLWVRFFDLNDNFVVNKMKDLAVTNSGDIYIALQVFNSSSASCLLKLDQNGNKYNDNTKFFVNVSINCVGVDTNQNVFIGGNFVDSFEGKSYFKAAGETTRGFIAKYNVAGVLQANWPQVFSGGKSSSVDKLAIAKDNSVSITGIFSGNYNFGGNKLISGPGTSHTFFSKYDTNGSMQWIQQDGIGNNGNLSNPYSIVTDDENNPIVAININTTSSVISIGSKSFNNVPLARKSFIVRFNNDGTPDFAIQGSPDDSRDVTSLFKDNDGNIILATANSISKISIKGIFIWKNLPLFNNSSSTTIVNSISSDANNTIFLTGEFTGNLTTVANIQTLNSSGNKDMFMLRFGK